MTIPTRPAHPPYTDKVYQLATPLVETAEHGQKLLTETWAERAERLEQEREQEKGKTNDHHPR